MRPSKVKTEAFKRWSISAIILWKPHLLVDQWNVEGKRVASETKKMKNSYVSPVKAFGLTSIA